MVVSATISTSPTMIYFGQEVGEPGNEVGGFGQPSRTSIFDYVGVPHHQRWMNGGKFDGGQLSDSEKSLRDYYKRLLNFTLKSKALMGEYKQIQDFNLEQNPGYDQGMYSFVRWKGDERLIIVVNFNQNTPIKGTIQVPNDIVGQWRLSEGSYPLQEQLFGKNNSILKISQGLGSFDVNLRPGESVILKLNNTK
jgi:glycosidase